MVNMGIKEIEHYAKEHHVPIMEQEGIQFLTKYIQEHEEICQVLEIGSAIGYSAIRMAQIRKTIHVTTIERDLERYQKAVENIQKMHLEEQITIHYGDAFDFTPDQTYDLIFIDAAKSQYIKFFEQFTPFLKPRGTVISDNLYFHGYTKQKERIESKNLRQLVQKIRNYISYLEQKEGFTTTIYEIGDGIGVTRKE